MFSEPIATSGCLFRGSLTPMLEQQDERNHHRATYRRSICLIFRMVRLQALLLPPDPGCCHMQSWLAGCRGKKVNVLAWGWRSIRISLFPGNNSTPLFQIIGMSLSYVGTNGSRPWNLTLQSSATLFPSSLQSPRDAIDTPSANPLHSAVRSWVILAGSTSSYFDCP